MWFRTTKGVLINSTHISKIYREQEPCEHGRWCAIATIDGESEYLMISGKEDVIDSYINALYARLTDAETPDGGCHE